jgi:hypothetical protein
MDEIMTVACYSSACRNSDNMIPSGYRRLRGEYAASPSLAEGKMLERLRYFEGKEASHTIKQLRVMYTK